MPTVSAVIPSYNRSEEVRRAINSVLSQSYDDLECIVVDDGSTDQTTEVVTSFEDDRLKLLCHERNRGVSAARNTGVEAADGEYIAFLDSDDEWASKKIERQVEKIQSKSDSWNSVYCNVHKYRKSILKRLFDRVLAENIGEEGGQELIKHVISMELAVHAGSTLLVERSSVLDVGGFDESMQRHEELEFLVRLLQNGKLAYLDEKLVTLYDSGYPRADLLEEEKQKFLKNIKPYLNDKQCNSGDIRANHELELAKAYFREGKIVPAYNHLKETRIRSIRDFAALTWSIKDGLTK